MGTVGGMVAADRAIQKENTIARGNGEMHFLLADARQRCPLELESFYGDICAQLIPGMFLSSLCGEFLRKIRGCVYGISKANLREPREALLHRAPMNRTFNVQSFLLGRWIEILRAARMCACTRSRSCELGHTEGCTVRLERKELFVHRKRVINLETLTIRENDGSWFNSVLYYGISSYRIVLGQKDFCGIAWNSRDERNERHFCMATGSSIGNGPIKFWEDHFETSRSAPRSL